MTLAINTNPFVFNRNWLKSDDEKLKEVLVHYNLFEVTPENIKTAFAKATDVGDLEHSKILLDKLAPTEPTIFYDAVMFVAAEKGYTEIAKLLLSREGLIQPNWMIYAASEVALQNRNDVFFLLRDLVRPLHDSLYYN